MSPPRLVLAGLILALASLPSLTVTEVRALPEMGADSQSQPPIVEVAFKDLGSYQGECFPWVRRVVETATGQQMGYDYRDGFLGSGAVEVSLSAAGPGDIIQIADDAYTAPDADYAGLHTAIILEANGDGTFRVIDSNSQWDGVVRIRDAYSPTESADRYPGLSFHIYRFGAIADFHAATPSTAAPLPAGNRLRVAADGDCLRLRGAAAIAADNIITCLPDRTEVAELEGRATADGYDWIQVATPWGQGWVAKMYVTPVETTATAAGETKPLYRYRAFLGALAADSATP